MGTDRVVFVVTDESTRGISIVRKPTGIVSSQAVAFRITCLDAVFQFCPGQGNQDCGDKICRSKLFK